jgi:hypothetical protein
MASVSDEKVTLANTLSLVLSSLFYCSEGIGDELNQDASIRQDGSLLEVSRVRLRINARLDYSLAQK